MQAAAGFPSYNQPGAWGGASGSPASPAGSLGPPSPAAPSVGMAAAPQSVGRPASVGGKPAADAPEDQDNPVALILGGVLMLAGAVFCYFWLADKELHGGTIRMPVLALLLYELLGKWGVSGLVALVGIVILGRGIQRARQ